MESIQFRNGATLKFMSGGGGDKSRAGFTSRVVVVTETDGLDLAGTKSRESVKITQLEARTRAYGSRKRIYLECTVSTEDGRTWREAANQKRTPETPAGGQINEVRFDQVTASKVRVVFAHAGKARSGVSEVFVWKDGEATGR